MCESAGIEFYIKFDLKIHYCYIDKNTQPNLILLF